MPEDIKFINAQTAIDRGYGSRSTLTRWAQQGVVRSFRQGRNLMLAVADLDAVKASRTSATTESEIVQHLAKQLADVAPALSPTSRAKLAELLR